MKWICFTKKPWRYLKGISIKITVTKLNLSYVLIVYVHCVLSFYIFSYCLLSCILILVYTLFHHLIKNHLVSWCWCFISFDNLSIYPLWKCAVETGLAISLPRNSLAKVPGYSSEENYLTFYVSSLILKVMSLFQWENTWLLGIVVYLLGSKTLQKELVQENLGREVVNAQMLRTKHWAVLHSFCPSRVGMSLSSWMSADTVATLLGLFFFFHVF